MERAHNSRQMVDGVARTFGQPTPQSFSTSFLPFSSKRVRLFQAVGADRGCREEHQQRPSTAYRTTRAMHLLVCPSVEP